MRSRLIVSARTDGPPPANGTPGAGVAGRGHAPKRAVISRRACSTVTAPTTATIVVSGRTRSP